MTEAGQELLIPVCGPRRSLRIAVYILLGLYAAAAIANAILDFEIRTVFPLLTATCLILSLALRWRHARADGHGIRRQSSFRTTQWSDVQALIEPGRWDTSVHLRSTAGKDLPTGVPAEYLDQLVSLSGKPLEQRPSAAAKPPTKQQHDLSERAARVKAQNCELMGDD